MIILNPLTIIRKRKGDEKQSCLSPLVAIKKPEGDPFISTIKEVEERKHVN